MKTIYLAGGCFWGVQKYFDQFDGVQATEVGYANGPDAAPSYRDVCNSSGHAETVKIQYRTGMASITPKIASCRKSKKSTRNRKRKQAQSWRLN